MTTIAKVIGTTRGGVFESSFREEAEIDLFAEQVVWPGLVGWIEECFKLGVEKDFPPELMILELYASGEPSEWSDLSPWQRGWAWMAGGTWLFSEKQPDIKGLVSLRNLNWSELTVDREGGHLVIGASCRLGDICDYPWPEDLTAGAAFRLAVEALAASWKVADVATVGGNLCLALPFGTMAPLMIALDARYELWDQAGTIRHLPACRFQRGNRDTVLDRGEVLRRVLILLEELQARASYFRFGNTASDPALVIACGVTNSRRRDLRIAVGGAFNAPLRFDFEHFPSEEEILSRVHRECSLDRYINDYRGGAQYRKHLLSTLLLRLREDLA